MWLTILSKANMPTLFDRYPYTFLPNQNCIKPMTPIPNTNFSSFTFTLFQFFQVLGLPIFDLYSDNSSYFKFYSSNSFQVIYLPMFLWSSHHIICTSNFTLAIACISVRLSNSPVMFQVVLPFERLPTHLTRKREIIFVGSLMYHQIVRLGEPPLTIFANKFALDCPHFSPVSAGVVFGLNLHNREHLGGCFCLGISKEMKDESLFSKNWKMGLCVKRGNILVNKQVFRMSSFRVVLIYQTSSFVMNGLHKVQL